MTADLSIYTRGAQLERQLQTLRPGQCFRMSETQLSDIVVPANPLDRQTPEYLAKWFHVRMPFYCTLHHGTVGQYWEICRPTIDP